MKGVIISSLVTAMLMLALFMHVKSLNEIDDERFRKIEDELNYLKSDNDTIKWDLDTLKIKSDTVINDIKDLKKGQKFIYDEVKKNDNKSFFDLFGL